MKVIIIICTLSLVLLGACASQPPPTLSTDTPTYTADQVIAVARASLFRNPVTIEVEYISNGEWRIILNRNFSTIKFGRFYEKDGTVKWN